jgi:HK97 family phage prohead protease
MKNLERRYVTDTLEMRGLPGQGAVLAGHAAVFNEETQIMAAFRERVMPGAFKKTIKEADVRALFNHDPNHVLGRNKAKTLRLSEDEAGLAYEIDLPETQFAVDLARLIERGDVTQSSFSFEMTKELWDYPKKESSDLPLRSLKEVKLWDVSPVTFPAYEGTDVDLQRALRSLSIELAQPLDDLVAAARMGVLLADTTTEPEAEPGDHSESTQESEQERAKRDLELLLVELDL